MISDYYLFQIDHPLVQQVWTENPNYLVEYTSDNRDSKYCAVYFSGHSIYFPNEAAIFESEIVKKNRYEWYGNRIPYAYKHIFVRDIHKQWYLSGINAAADSPEKLLTLLKNLTEGYKVITVGSSAGGYAAVLYGTLLHAKKCLAFSPRMDMASLENVSPKNVPLYHQFKNTERKKYMSLGHFLDFSQSNVFCFYPILSRLDKIQLAYIASLPASVRQKINIIRFNTKKHGVPFPKIALQSVFELNSEQLKRLARSTHHPLSFSIKQVGFITTIGGIFAQYYRHIKNRQRKK